MCGSGTFLIEAALAVWGMTPAMRQRRLGAPGWRGHDTSARAAIMDSAPHSWLDEPPAHGAITLFGQDRDPLQLARVLSEQAAVDRCLLVDCLTLWLSNLLSGEPYDEERFEEERSALLELLPQLPGQVILVSNEVGLGIVPLGELTRRFCDESGRLHQTVAALCDRVTFVTAGLPMTLKG